MKCYAKNEMKFKEFSIPAGTEGFFIGNAKRVPVAPGSACGINIRVAFSLADAAPSGTLISAVEFPNEIHGERCREDKMTGIVVSTNCAQVYFDCKAPELNDVALQDYSVKSVFGGKVPEKLPKGNSYSGDYMLVDVIDYIENEFADWVQENCEFIPLTAQDIADGYYPMDTEPGATVLSDEGCNAFFNKEKEYLEMLHRIGYHCKLRGGLNWE